MRKLGKKQLMLHLHQPLQALPAALADYSLELSADGCELVYTYDTQRQHNDITALFKELAEAGIEFNDLQTKQTSLEEIFVNLVRNPS
jgi:ABC-2 type transport system ATP-binding protein